VCCCSSGIVYVSLSNSSSLLISSALNGGSGCFGQEDLSGNFLINASNPYAVSAQFNEGGLTAVFTAALQANDTNTLTISDSFEPNCVSVATRISSSSMTGGAINANTSQSLTGTSGAAVSAFALSSIIGSYVSDGSCVPSVQCCCTDGISTISVDPSTASLVVDTTLAGVSLSCLGMDGPITFSFVPQNATFAQSTFDGVTFDAQHNSDGSVTISNTLHPACPSRLIKTNTTSNSATSSLSLSLSTLVTVSAVILPFAYCLTP